jgi:hypothetical protein
MRFRTNWEEISRQIEEMAERKKEKVIQEVDLALHRGAMNIHADAVLLAPVNIGELRRKTYMAKMDVCHYTVGNRLPYALPVEFGSRAHTPPIDAIKEYARDIGREEDWFKIWNGIRKNGTRPQPFMRPAFFKNESAIRAKVKTAVRKGLRDE